MTIDQLHKHLTAHTPTLMDVKARYAVLVPLVELANGPHLLFETRAAALRFQPREVCFPGGRMEPGENSVDCALRETREELGIPSECIHVLGELDFLCHRSGFAVFPVLARLDVQALQQLVLNPDEVDDIFLVPLSSLFSLTPEEYSFALIPAPAEDFPYESIGIPKDYPWPNGIEAGPIYSWQDKAIWGITGRITRHLLSLLNQEGT